MGLGKAQDRAVGTICAIFRIVRLGVHAAGETSVQFAECIINTHCTISLLLAVSHLAFRWVFFFIAVSNT